MRRGFPSLAAAALVALLGLGLLAPAAAATLVTPSETCCPDCGVFVQSDGSWVLAGGTSISFGLPPLWLWLVIILLIIVIILQAFILGRMRRRAEPASEKGKARY